MRIEFPFDEIIWVKESDKRLIWLDREENFEIEIVSVKDADDERIGRINIRIVQFNGDFMLIVNGRMKRYLGSRDTFIISDRKLYDLQGRPL